MIVFSNVSKTYPNGVQALKDVKLTINDGEFVAIIGLSGAGKSTLLRSIDKMHEISEGSIFIDDVDVSKLKDKELRLMRRNIGMIFQSFNLVKRMNVFNNVLAGRVAYHNTFKTVFALFPKEDKLIALDSVGANVWQKIRYGVLPNILPDLSSITLYRLDINVRAASILGLVSAGGIGSILTIASSMWSWELLGTILLAVIIMVMLVDFISSSLRKKLV